MADQIRVCIDAAASLRDKYRSISFRQPFGTLAGQDMLATSATLESLATDHECNQSIHSALFAGHRWTGLERRLKTLHGIAKRSPTWKSEVDAMKPYLGGRELWKLRDKSLKFLKRAYKAGEIELLVDELPLKALLSDLNTREIVKMSAQSPRLTRKTAKARRRLMNEDLARLDATILLVQNSRQRGGHVMDVSHSLAEARLRAARGRR